jgi:serine/threonine protein kinase
MSGDENFSSTNEKVQLGKRFDFQQKLGHGAYGTVYKAYDK